MDSNGATGINPINEEKEDDVVIPLNHPDLPPDIKLKKRIKKRRADPVAAHIDPKVVLNEKNLRCEEFAKSGTIHPNFSDNTNKEKLVLEHVKKYSNAFTIEYVEKKYIERDRDLFLYPLNECKVEKFICTTLR